MLSVLAKFWYRSVEKGRSFATLFRGLRLGALREVDFSIRLGFVWVFLVGVALTILSVQVIVIYRADRRDSILEFQKQKVEILESRFQAYLFDHFTAVKYKRGEEPFVPKDIEIERMPQGEERFLGFWEGKIVAIWTDAQENLWVKHISLPLPIWEDGDDRSYVVTENGRLVSTNRNEFEWKKSGGMPSAALTHRAHSSREGALFVQDSLFKESALAFASLPNSNVVIYSEASIAGYLMSIRSVSGVLLFVFGCLLFGVMTLATILSIQISETMRSLVAHILEAEKGKTLEEKNSLGREFSSLHENISGIGKVINSTEQEAILEFHARQKYFHFCEQIPQAICQREIAMYLIDIFMFATQKVCASPSLTFYVQEKSSTPNETLSILFKSYFVLSGIIVADPWLKTALNDGLDMSKIEVLLRKQMPALISTREAVFPLVAETDLLGFWILTDNNVSSLSQASIEWLSLACDAAAIVMRQLPDGWASRREKLAS